jgi:acetylornithine deacetylase
VDPLERDVLALIDTGEVVDTASRLIAVPTLSGGEDAGQEVMVELLKEAGAEVTTWRADTDALATDPWFSAEFDRRDPLCVLGSIGSGSGPTLLVDGHIDVVPTGHDSDWTTPPFAPQVRGGALYGRGACDMKGGLAAALHAMRAISRSGVTLRGTVRLASVYGEEDGGSGTLAVLAHGVGADACVIPEPTELSVVPAVAGALSFRVRVAGRSAHGALREEGVSAVERLPLVQQALLDLERRRNARPHDAAFDWLQLPFSVCTGRIAGGDWPSSEAAWLTMEGRYGVAPGEDLDVARAELEAAVVATTAQDDWLASHPPTVEWWGGQFFPAVTDPADPVVTTVVSAVDEVVPGAAVVRGMPYGCDMGLTVGRAGIPTVVFGPGDIRAAHAPDEHVPVDDLIACSRALALTMLRYCR